jgi:thioredoxin-like negative regulator of GroEL
VWGRDPTVFGLLAPRPPPPPPAAAAAVVPITIEPKPAADPPPAAPPAPAPLPVAAPEPVVESPVGPPPEQIVKTVPKAPPAPKGPKAMLAEAARLREKGKVERALDLFGRVAEADPENVEALTGRGLCYLDLERYPPAEASFQAALGVAPDAPGALLGLAETYRWQGKNADAIRYYEQYLAKHPDGDEANVARNALEQLRK